MKVVGAVVIVPGEIVRSMLVPTTNEPVPMIVPRLVRVASVNDAPDADAGYDITVT